MKTLTDERDIPMWVVGDNYNAFLDEQVSDWVKQLNKLGLDEEADPDTWRVWRYFFHQTNRYNLTFVPYNALVRLEHDKKFGSEFSDLLRSWTSWVWNYLEEEIQKAWEQGEATTQEKLEQHNKEHEVIDYDDYQRGDL